MQIILSRYIGMFFHVPNEILKYTYGDFLLKPIQYYQIKVYIYIIEKFKKAFAKNFSSVSSVQIGIFRIEFSTGYDMHIRQSFPITLMSCAKFVIFSIWV